MEAAEPIHQRTLGDGVVEALARSILSGQYAPGQRLVESELAHRFAVSRGPVRDALRVLHEEGLVVKRTHTTAVVRPWSVADLQDLAAFRSVVEAFAARLAATRRTQADLEALARAVSGMEQALAAGDLHALIREDVTFHMAVADASHHRYATRTVHSLRRQIELFMTTEKLVHAPSRFGHLVAEHRAIADRIRAADPDGAARSMRAHLEETMADLAARMSSGKERG